MLFTKKDRPIAAGGRQEPKVFSTETAPVPAPIVPPPAGEVKGLESLRPGVMFTAGGMVFAVIGVQPVPMGRLVTFSACRYAGREGGENYA